MVTSTGQAVAALRWRAAPVRLLGAGLLVAMAWLHLHLWDLGYRYIHVIGPLFLVNAVAGFAVALALLVVPGRLLPWIALAGGLLALGTLGGLVLSTTTGLFGFEETWQATDVPQSVAVEAAAAVLLLGYAGTVLVKARRR